MRFVPPVARSPLHRAAEAAVHRLVETPTLRTLLVMGDPADLSAAAVARYSMASLTEDNKVGAPWCEMHDPNMGIPSDDEMRRVQQAPVVVFYKAHGGIDAGVLYDFVMLVRHRHERGLRTIITSRVEKLAEWCHWLTTHGVNRDEVLPLWNLLQSDAGRAVSLVK
jgi:hypothetical protein